EMALDLPGDTLAQANLSDSVPVPQLPLRTVGIGARVEIGRAAEIVLGLGRVGNLAANPREPEHPDRLALMRVAEQIELTTLKEQVVGVHAPRADLVASHRVVVEDDRLVAKDRRLDLGQPYRQLVAAGGGG